MARNVRVSPCAKRHSRLRKSLPKSSASCRAPSATVDCAKASVSHRLESDWNRTGIQVPPAGIELEFDWNPSLVARRAPPVQVFMRERTGDHSMPRA